MPAPSWPHNARHLHPCAGGGHGALRFQVLPGLLSVPMGVAPFASLLLAQVLVPRASWLGHLAGILSGLALALGLLDWVTPYWAACVAMWAAIGA